MLPSYGVIGVFVIVAILFPLVALSIAWLVRPKKPTSLKKSTYECGMETFGDAWVQFRVQYYLYALVFVLFDIETVFLLPWAVVLRDLGVSGLVQMAVFIVVLLIGFVYAWKKGALEWE